MTTLAREAHVADAEWRTALVDESRTYEIWSMPRRDADVLIAECLGPTLALTASTVQEES